MGNLTRPREYSRRFPSTATRRSAVRGPATCLASAWDPAASASDPEASGSDPEGSGLDPEGAASDPEASGSDPEGWGLGREGSASGPEASGLALAWALALVSEAAAVSGWR